MIQLARLTRRWEKSRLEIVISMLLVGAAACLAAYAVGAPREPWKSLLLSVGSGALGGGIFAWLTKLAQIGGVIREELEAVIYSKDHLSIRSDREMLWTNATRSLYGNRFPKLMEKLTTDVLRNLLPSEQRFYLRDARRRIRIELIDRATALIRVSTQFQAVLCTDCEPGSPPVERRSWYTFVPESIAEENRKALLEGQRSKYWLSRDVRANGPPAIVDAEASTEKLPTGETQVTFVATLAPATEYVVRDGGDALQNARQDNVICFVAASYIDGLEVTVDYPKNELVLQFHPLGAVRFEDEYPPAAEIHKRTHDILFSDVGFLLTVQLRNP